jgi:hypothetical protein
MFESPNPPKKGGQKTEQVIYTMRSDPPRSLSPETSGAFSFQNLGAKFERQYALRKPHALSSLRNLMPASAMLTLLLHALVDLGRAKYRPSK